MARSSGLSPTRFERPGVPRRAYGWFAWKTKTGSQPRVSSVSRSRWKTRTEQTGRTICLYSKAHYRLDRQKCLSYNFAMATLVGVTDPAALHDKQEKLFGLLRDLG